MIHTGQLIFPNMTHNSDTYTYVAGLESPTFLKNRLLFIAQHYLQSRPSLGGRKAAGVRWADWKHTSLFLRQLQRVYQGDTMGVAFKYHLCIHTKLQKTYLSHVKKQH